MIFLIFISNYYLIFYKGLVASLFFVYLTITYYACGSESY